MLIRFHGENLLYFNNFDIEFDDRLNVITGETGAGKSILLKALQALLGNKTELPAGNGCYLEALFDPSENLKRQLRDLSLEEDELVVSLTIGKRWVYRLNGRMFPQSTVAQLFEDEVQFHQQNSQTSLLKPRNQIALIDSFYDSKELLEEYQNVYREYRETEKYLSDHREEILQKRLDELQAQLEYFEKVNPSLSEEKELREKYERMVKFQELSEMLAVVLSILEGESEGSLRNLWNILHKLEKNKHLLPTGFVELLEEIVEKSEELSRIAKTTLEEMEIEDLRSIEERIWDYNELKRRYGPELEDVMKYYENIKQERDRLAEELLKLKQAVQKISVLRKNAFDLAKKIHSARIEAAKQLEYQIENHLKDLSMSTKLTISIRELKDLTLTGISEVDFLILSHKNEQAPMKNVLSGGELSRMMLALELAIANRFFSKTLIFDEIDSGIGGLTGNVLGIKLSKVSKSLQTIVVTHLPQIARFADRHFVVEKTEQSKMILKMLSGEERKKEMVRMIGGEQILWGEES